MGNAPSQRGRKAPSLNTDDESDASDDNALDDIT
jgi:hypothetical protein